MEEKDKISSEIKTKLEDAQERIELSKKTHTKHKKQKNENEIFFKGVRKKGWRKID